MKIVFMVIIILLLGAFYIAREQGTNFKTLKGSWAFSKVYVKWIWQVGTNIKDLGTYAYHMKWLPQFEPSSDSGISNFTVITIPS